MTKLSRMSGVFVPVFLIMLVVGVNPLWAGKKKNGPRLDKDRAKIMQIVTEWVPALRSGEVDRNLAFFTEDILIAGPGSTEVQRGRKEVKDRLTQLLDGYRPEEGSIKVQTIQINGEWAEVCAKFTAVWEPRREGIKKVEESSNYFWLLNKQSDDSWRIARFLFYPAN